MMGTRTAVAVALILALTGVVAAFTALLWAARDDGGGPGRTVQTRMNLDYGGAPVFFPLDDVWVSKGEDGDLHAFYAYPPGFYGHARGCKVVWSATDSVRTDGGRVGPGLFVDPCGGARFNADGELVQGPADRGLDYFDTLVEVSGIAVDTRRLYCGMPSREDTGSGAARTPTPASEERQECERASASRDFR